jgi:hypothetical protein
MSIDAVDIEKGQGPSLGRLLEEWTMLAKSEAFANAIMIADNFQDEDIG